MTSFRHRRGWVAALVLLPVTALMIASTAVSPANARTSRNGTAQLTTSDRTVRPNEKVTVRGRFRPIAQQAAGIDAGGDPAAPAVRIQFRALGARYWHDVRSTRAAKTGRFKKRMKVSRSGRIRALSADGRATRAHRVTVRSVTRARVEKRAKVGQKVTVRGRVAPAGTKRKVTVKVGGDKLRTRTDKRGRFKAKWKPRKAGHHRVKVRASGNLVAKGSRARAGKVTIFRNAEASWYGPGLYGNGVACGGTLTPSTMGVAHKTMPCGTKLTIRYHGRQVKAKVIDRGPYVPGREFDLTEAVKNKLGMGGVGIIQVDR
ncbi:MAG: septal ring lytic transglycosylase RlpA family protein [Solirubrobacterales bacterium]|nr:RlpA-like double-psi beta-barrel domain-containing protein [Solirubrobacterales bacterium]